ncbi:protocadherin-1 [Clonorchis sinensis]|uniref:Protocadherin-1 n=1 Tax=Clonorchis sinensis TaxID=79923 RepID=H2KUA7_CLOSI|nr:protocadherin-1 [Clonorchis sinensis]
MDYSGELFLKLQSKLDREMRSSYQILITATDQAPVHQKTGHLFLHVIVEDVNDSPPKFEKSLYVFHVHESTSPGLRVGAVHADDEDSGENGEVTYRLLHSFFNGSCRYTWKNRFRIDAGTGVIRVHSPLDREQDPKLVFQVEAIDHGQPERSATTKVIILLLDDNDNSPSIRVWGKHMLTNPNGLVGCSDPDACSLLTVDVQMQLTIWVTEWLKPDSVVAFLESWDLDELERGNVTCLVNSGEYLLQPVQELLIGNNLFVKQSASNKSGDPCAILSSKQSSKFYQLVTLHNMDWELKPHIYIPIVCHDADKVLPRSSTLLLQISVRDENDNAPIFNLPVIVSPAIWINKHDWLLNATEGKIGPMRSLMPFQKQIKVVVPETLTPNTTFAYFSGYDADDSQNSELLFQISSGEPSGLIPPSPDALHLLAAEKGFLSINETTGSLFTTSSLLSTPAHHWHNFQVVLSDKGKPALTNSLPISLWIQTVNQHPPELLIDVEFRNGIHHPKDHTSSSGNIKIMENEPPGTPVCRLKAIDFDRQEAGQVSFWLVGVYKVEQNATTIIQENTFLLNNRTGLVTTTRFLDREQDGDELILHIYAQDYGTPMKTTLKNISVHILDMNDNTPIFLMPLKSCFKGLVTADPESNSQLVFLNENFTYEHTIPHFVSGDAASYPGVLFRARDADIGQNGAVSYSITPSCLFSTDVLRVKQVLTLDDKSGCLVPNKQIIDQDLPAVFHFRLMAHDSDANRQLWSALELVVSARLTNNSSLTLEISGCPTLFHCQIQPQDQDGQATRAQTVDELTPLMRALLSVTVMAGAMVVTVVIFVLVKRPGWIIGRNYVFEASQKVKIDIFQCRTDALRFIVLKLLRLIRRKDVKSGAA